VLCLDERPECRRHVLEVWRQRTEEGGISCKLASIPNHPVLAACARQIIAAKGS
jgi:hypothetical protein